jgi:hypothetical protein
MLAVPASALALTGTAGSDTRPAAALPVRVTPHHVRLGRRVTVSGRAARADAGETVELEAAHSSRGRWRRLATARIGGRGGYALHARPRRSGVLRAVAIATRPAAAAHATRVATAPAAPHRVAAVSRTASIEVKAVMRVAERERSVLAGRNVDIAGHLLPGRAGRTVTVQDLVASGWRALARGRTGRAGGFAVPVRASEAGRSHLRVVFRGDRLNGRATAGAGSLTLFVPSAASWYDDAGTTACGFHAGDGVANRTLPCGTKVRMRHAGHTITATVDDRGPYVGGRDWDLDQRTAGALHFGGVGTIEVSVRR